MERLQRKFRGAMGGKNIGNFLQNTLGVGAALLLFSLIMITCMDVVGRYFFSAPLSGAFEITELLLAALVFAALPLTTERKEHIEVDLINMVLSNKSKRYLSIFAGLFSAALLATLAWRLALHALSAAEDGATTNALRIPLAPFGFLAAFSCLVSALMALIRGFYSPHDFDYDGGDDHV